jgi:hypothetical protein
MCVSFEGILQWNDESDSAVAQIERNHRPLKILLKTKDDPVMLQGWITHHQKIVGLDGLILMDNMSTDPKVAEIYAGLQGDAVVIRFSGFLDNVHHTEHFAKLYSALRSSCSHFIFLDTDERLTLFDGPDHFRSDPSLIPFLKDHPTTDIFPGTWLQNVTGYRDRFSLYDPNIPLINGLKWGKPVISTSSNFSGFINHNTQMEHSLYAEPLITNFFVLHLSRVSNQQRIHSNLLKLKAFGAIPDEWGGEEVLRRPPEEWDHLPDTLKSYVRQIFEIHEEGPGFAGNLGGSIQIAEDGLLICSEDWQKQALLDFVSSAPQFVSELLSA